MSGMSFILAGMLAAATPFLLAALGELVVERAGVLNLGLEGIMALGAVVAFIVVYHGGGHPAAFAVAALAGCAIHNALIEIDGTAACRVNLVAGEYS